MDSVFKNLIIKVTQCVDGYNNFLRSSKINHRFDISQFVRNCKARLHTFFFLVEGGGGGECEKKKKKKKGKKRKKKKKKIKKKEK